MDHDSPSDDTAESDESIDEKVAQATISGTASDDGDVDMWESVTVELDVPYTAQSEVSDTVVELRVTEATMTAGRADAVLTADGDAVAHEDAFRDVATATDYEVYAGGDLIIEGGEPRGVNWLQETLCKEVGVARRAKQRLIDAGWDSDELDEFSNDAEEALMDLYTNVDISGAETIVKGMVFQATDDEELVEQVDTHPAEVRHWVEDTREQLRAALDAVDEIEDMAKDMLDNEYHDATLPADGESDTDADGEADAESDIDVPSIDEIRTAMFDSDMPSESFARRETDLADGRTLEVRPGSYLTEVVVTDEDGDEEQVGTSDSLAEAVQMFEEYRLTHE